MRGSSARRRRAAAAVVALALAACSDPAPEAAEVRVGTGQIAFEPLDDGDPLGLVAGPQGAHHVVIHARARGIATGDPDRVSAPDNPLTRFAARTAGGDPLAADDTRTGLGYVEGEDGWHRLPSGRLLVIREDVVADLYGDEVTVSVRVTDSRGATATDEARVVIVDAAGPDAGP